MTTIPEQKTKEIVPEFKFHHLHMYCDELKSTEEYKNGAALEQFSQIMSVQRERNGFGKWPKGMD